MRSESFLQLWLIICILQLSNVSSHESYGWIISLISRSTNPPLFLLAVRSNLRLDCLSVMLIAKQRRPYVIHILAWWNCWHKMSEICQETDVLAMEWKAWELMDCACFPCQIHQAKFLSSRKRFPVILYSNAIQSLLLSALFLSYILPFKHS